MLLVLAMRSKTAPTRGRLYATMRSIMGDPVRSSCLILAGVYLVIRKWLFRTFDVRSHKVLTHVWHLFLPNGSTMRFPGLGLRNVVTNELPLGGSTMRKTGFFCAY